VRDCAAGDLGAIDAKYDIAVSTAAAALDFIVVDDTAAAQACVELLRRNGLGVATFLILDKQAHLAQRAAEKAAPPEGEAPACKMRRITQPGIDRAQKACLARSL
jgi:structural maintenance of chromosome 4